MLNNSLQTVKYEVKDRVARVTLNRPEVHNAFNDVMINELTQVFKDLNAMAEVRVIVLSGEGKSFCAGADLNWMKKVKDYTYLDNLKESMELAGMFHIIYSSPKPTIARVQGTAIGGGTGLVAVCDLAVSSADAKFSFSEVKLGLIPACISPYVLKKCGEGKTRELFLTGERISAEKALSVGLINKAVPGDELDNTVNELVNQLISSGPKAIEKCKELVSTVSRLSYDNVMKYTAEIIAKMRMSDEAQEGMIAFLDKRKPNWSK